MTSRPRSVGSLTAEYVIFALVFSCVWFLRSPDALLNPAFYAEDGIWMGSIYSNGLWETLRNARPDYPVFGNILLLYGASVAHSIFAYAHPEQLPAFVAGASYLFLGSVSAVPLLAMRGYVEWPWRLLMCLCIVLVPMGTHLNETVGRVLNLGFAFNLIAALSLIARMRVQGRLAAAPLDALVLLCCLTSPIATGVVAVYLVLRLISERGFPPQDILLWLVLINGLAVIVDGLGKSNVDPGTSMGLEGAYLLGVSRSIVYPLTFPFYSELNHMTSGIIAAVAASFLVLAVLAKPRPPAFLFFSLATGLVIAATTVMRPGLAHYLVGYASSFPDRYFYAQNAMLLICVVWAAAQMMKTGRKFQMAFPATIGAVYAFSLPLLFEAGSLPGVTVVSGPSFAEQLEATEPHGNGLDLVPIYPEGWKAVFPDSFARPTSTLAR